MISVVSQPGVEYPAEGDCYSPSDAFPEYRFDHVASRPNAVYRMVRRLLEEHGLDEKKRDSPSWNPLGEFIPRGSKVFVLCNFVNHRRPRESRRGFHAKCIHGSVLRALLDYVLIATGEDGRVQFGNAPLQGCDWDRVLRETGAGAVADFYRGQGAPVEARDLRLYVTERTLLGRVASETRLDDADAVEIDLGGDSLLADLASPSGTGPGFRVSQYDPARTESFHAGSSHRYVVHRAVLDADVVISLSKLKTHEKVGITCGLKGFVGAVAHKDCLAHHRFGSNATGGDEYPASLRFLHPLSRFHDWTHRRDQAALVQGAAEIADHTFRRIMRVLGLQVAGAWHGNDTCWRMALDLARIVHHADREGRMHEGMTRTHLSLIDGMIAGEGDGPLAPSPVAAGTLLFSEDVAWGDRVACRLMGYPVEAIPLVGRAFEPLRYALPAARAEEVPIRLNGCHVAEAELEPCIGRPFRPPSGWRSQLPGGR